MFIEEKLELADPRNQKTYFLNDNTTRRVFTRMVRGIFHLISTIQVEGVEHLPLTGGVVLASNHLTNFDVFPMQFALPRLIFFMGKAELFKNPVLDPVLRRLGGFPVNRGARDDWAMEYAASILDRGQVLGIFPEGKRSHGQGLHTAKTGAARLALRSGSPIVPMAVQGTDRLFEHFPRRSPIHIQMGEPIYPQPHQSSLALTDRVMYSIAEMLPLHLRGVYADKAKGFD